MNATHRRDIAESVLQLPLAYARQLLKLLKHLTAKDGFSAAYRAFLKAHEGPEGVPYELTEGFIDSWEARHG